MRTGLEGQHTLDLCKEGQSSIDGYVAFLKLNSINSKTAIVPGVGYTFAVQATAGEFVARGGRFKSLDLEAMELFGIVGGESGISIYDHPISIYGHGIGIYT
jgi:hypothetical protein